MAKKQLSELEKLLGRNKPKEEPEVEEFMEIGGSPVPGITLRRVLRADTEDINHISWSPDGRYLASLSNEICIWDIVRNECVVKFGKSDKSITVSDWSPNGKYFSN